jgi:hypothetical protein
MKRWRLLTCCLAALLHIPPAYAADCEPRLSDLDHFARFRIGQPLKALPKGVKRLPNCFVDRKYHSFDCAFEDADGASYIAGGHEVTLVERDFAGSSVSSSPSPLKPGISLDEATRLLAAANPTMEFTTSHSDNGSSIFTPECLKNRYGVYYLSLSFDKADRLAGLSAGFITPEN